MKKVFALYRTGIFVLVPIFVVIALISWLWEAVYGLSFGNIWIATGLLIFGPMLFGWVISKQWMRALFLDLCSQIPVVSTATQILFNHEFIERLKGGEMPAVLVPVGGGGWAPGVMVRKFEWPDDPRNPKSKKRTWVVVLAPATTPVVFTSQLRIYRESQIIYTGKNIADMALAFASLGLNMNLDPEQFTVAPQKELFDDNTNDKTPPGQ